MDIQYINLFTITEYYVCTVSILSTPNCFFFFSNMYQRMVQKCPHYGFLRISTFTAYPANRTIVFSFPALLALQLLPLLSFPLLPLRFRVQTCYKPGHLHVVQFGVMSSLFLNNEHTLLLYSINMFPLDNSNPIPFYSHIRAQVMMFVRHKMPNVPSASLTSWYTRVLYYLASFEGSPVSPSFFRWEYLTYGPGLDSNFHSQAPNPEPHYPSNDSLKASHPSNHRNEPSATLIPSTPDSTHSRSRSFTTSGRFESDISGMSTSNLRLSPQSLLPAFSQVTRPTRNLSVYPPTPPLETLAIHRPAPPAAPTTNQLPQLESSTMHPSFIAFPTVPFHSIQPSEQTAHFLSGKPTTRYEFISGYPVPPELSSKAVVRDFLQEVFPCHNGSWTRLRGDRFNITFSCSCPVPFRIRISRTSSDAVSSESQIHYYVPHRQGIPHDGPLLYPSDESFQPWEIFILKEMIGKNRNMQPTNAYKLWTVACTNHEQLTSSCPAIFPSISSQPVPQRSLETISKLYPKFLAFFRYYRNHLRRSVQDLSTPSASVASLWSFQTKHSFWNHLQMLTDEHHFQPMPTHFFATIDQLASFLRITPTMIFTIPVDTTDLHELKLPPSQKMQAFGSVFCFGLPHLWTLCLFLKLELEQRALLSDFTKLSRIGIHLNVVGPCSHQINRHSKQRITRRKHSLGLQICPGELTPAVFLYHKSLQRLAPRVFAGSEYKASVDSSDQSRAVFSGTLSAFPSILKIPDKVHITRHCVEDVTWRAKMKDKKNSPGGYTIPSS
jgi:hypothetical protein